MLSQMISVKYTLLPRELDGYRSKVAEQQNISLKGHKSWLIKCAKTLEEASSLGWYAKTRTLSNCLGLRAMSQKYKGSRYARLGNITCVWDAYGVTEVCCVVEWNCAVKPIVLPSIFWEYTGIIDNWLTSFLFSPSGLGDETLCSNCLTCARSGQRHWKRTCVKRS